MLFVAARHFNTADSDLGLIPVVGIVLFALVAVLISRIGKCAHDWRSNGYGRYKCRDCGKEVDVGREGQE